MDNISEKFINLPSGFDTEVAKNILLIGAGFSKGFGTLLANEISNKIYNQPNISNSIKIMINNLADSNYEEVYEELINTDKYTFGESLINIFSDMDNNVKKHISQNTLFIDKFIKLFRTENHYDLIFTLNQDIVIERYILQERKDKQNKYKNNEDIRKNLDEIIGLTFPYANYKLSNVVKFKEGSNGCIQEHTRYNFDDYIQVVKYEKNNQPSKIYLNYVKLHGSSNWDHSEGHVILATGRKKELNENILKASIELFKYVMNMKDKNIVIVGYGFMDKHINDILFNAIENNAKIFVINTQTQDEFKQSLVKNAGFTNEKKALFLKALEKYYSLSFTEFISGDEVSQKLFDQLKNELNK